jgi:hypothetical protein
LDERKLLQLDLGFRVSPRWRRRWRKNVINGRLANRWQRRFLNAVRDPIDALDQGQLPRFRAEIADMAKQLSLHAQEWEAEIDRKVAAAERIFDSLAGPLPPKRFDNLLQRVRQLRRQAAGLRS